MTASASTSESSVIRIDDRQADGRSILNLAEVLAMLPSSAAELVWAVQDLVVSGVTRSGGDVHEIEIQTKQEPSGLVLKWPDLLTLAGQVTQVQEGVLIGSRDPNHVPPLGADSGVLVTYPIVLEVIDASYWLLHTLDRSERAMLARAFRSVRPASVSDL